MWKSREELAADARREWGAADEGQLELAILSAGDKRREHLVQAERY